MKLIKTLSQYLPRKKNETPTLQYRMASFRFFTILLIQVRAKGEPKRYRLATKQDYTFLKNKKRIK